MTRIIAMIERIAVRGVLQQSNGDVLLMKMHPPTKACPRWTIPGGGVESGEDPIKALRRELFEETSLQGFGEYTHIWHQDVEYTKKGGLPTKQSNEYFLIPVVHFEPELHAKSNAYETSVFRGFKWWKIIEICDSEEDFLPVNLGLLLAELVANGTPETPIDLGPE